MGQANLSSPQQSQFINSLVGGLAPQAQQAYGQLLQPYDPQQFQSLFQQAFIDPAMMNYEQQVLPSIYQSFGDANAGSSSALNQALAASARDLSTGLGQQMGNFYQNYQQQQLGALGQVGGLAGTRILDPIVQQGYNPMGDLIGAGGQIGASALPYILSDRNYKENIREFEKDALNDVESMNFYRYRYKPEVGIEGEKVGLMAQDLPEDYIKGSGDEWMVDHYALTTTALKAIQQLSAKVKELESALLKVNIG